MNLLRRIRFCANSMRSALHCALHMTFPPASNLRDIADITLLKRQIRQPSRPYRAKGKTPQEPQKSEAAEERQAKSQGGEGGMARERKDFQQGEEMKHELP